MSIVIILKWLKSMEEYLEANDKFENKGIKAQAVKARKVLMEIGKLTKARRAEIQEKKNAM